MDWGVSHNHREGALETLPARWQGLLCVLTEEGNREDLSPSCYNWDGTSSDGSAGIFPTLPPSMFCCGAVLAGESQPQSGRSPGSSAPSGAVAYLTPLRPWAEFGPC